MCSMKDSFQFKFHTVQLKGKLAKLNDEVTLVI